MKNQEFAQFPRNWLENLSETAQIALDDWLTNNAPPDIRQIVDFQDAANQYLLEGDTVSPRTHQDLLGRMAAGLSALARVGVNFNSDESLLSHDNTKQ